MKSCQPPYGCTCGAMARRRVRASSSQAAAHRPPASRVAMAPLALDCSPAAPAPPHSSAVAETGLPLYPLPPAAAAAAAQLLQLSSSLLVRQRSPQTQGGLQRRQHLAVLWIVEDVGCPPVPANVAAAVAGRAWWQRRRQTEWSELRWRWCRPRCSEHLQVRPARPRLVPSSCRCKEPQRHTIMDAGAMTITTIAGLGLRGHAIRIQGGTVLHYSKPVAPVFDSCMCSILVPHSQRGWAT